MVYKKVSKKQAQCKLYGNIGDWMTNGETFTAMLDEISNSGMTEIEFREHCYGGSVFEGNVMGNAIEGSDLNISFVIDGLAASMGFFILMSVPKENISICDNAFGMIHRPSSGNMGDADTHLAAAKLLQDMETNMIAKIAERSGLTTDEVKAKWFDGKDHWLNADEMVQYGFAGKKVKPVAASIKSLDKQIVEQSTPETIYARFAAALNTNQKKDSKKMNIALWIAAFQLEGLTAESSEEAVLAAVQAKQNKLNERITTLEADAKAKADAAVTAELDAAEAAKKFDGIAGMTKEQVRAQYKELGEKMGVATLKTVLAGLKGGSQQPTIMQTITPGANTTGAAAQAGVQNWEWYQKNNPAALQAMSDESHPDHGTFKELYKAEYGNYPG